MFNEEIRKLKVTHIPYFAIPLQSPLVTPDKNCFKMGSNSRTFEVLNSAFNEVMSKILPFSCAHYFILFWFRSKFCTSVPLFAKIRKSNLYFLNEETEAELLDCNNWVGQDRR